ncbi:MAG: hypothetical protein ACRDHN_08540 [Thermomicrobiales bacterium]
MTFAETSRFRISRRNALAMTCGAAAGIVLNRGGLASAVRSTPDISATHEVFFGWVLGVENIISVAIDASDSDAAGDRVIRAYVCDGPGHLDGVARWFNGMITLGETVTISAPGSEETITISTLRKEIAAGTLVGSDGVAHPFAAIPAIDGAGVYKVTVNEDSHYAGTSTHDSILSAQASSDGTVTGIVTTVDGTEIALVNRSIALFPAEAHAVNGLPAVFETFENSVLASNMHIALVFPEGTFWLDRSSDRNSTSPVLI